MTTPKEDPRTRRFEWGDDDIQRLVIVKSKNITREKPSDPPAKAPK